MDRQGSRSDWRNVSPCSPPGFQVYEYGESVVPHPEWDMTRWRMICSSYSLWYFIHSDWMMSLTSLCWQVGCAVFHLCRLFVFQLVNDVIKCIRNPRNIRQGEQDLSLRKMHCWLSSRNGAKRKPTRWTFATESGDCNCWTLRHKASCELKKKLTVI
jgi:hypothetical protein